MMDQHAASIIAINNDNIVPTIKISTICSCGIYFTKLEDLVICQAFISTSKDPIIKTSQKGQTISRSHVYDIQQVDQEPILRGQVKLQ